MITLQPGNARSRLPRMCDDFGGAENAIAHMTMLAAALLKWSWQVRAGYMSTGHARDSSERCTPRASSGHLPCYLGANANAGSGDDGRLPSHILAAHNHIAGFGVAGSHAGVQRVRSRCRDAKLR